jgi:hypothetical protein
MNFPNYAYRNPSMEREIRNFSFLVFRRPIRKLFAKRRDIKVCDINNILKKYNLQSGIENRKQKLTRIEVLGIISSNFPSNECCRDIYYLIIFSGQDFLLNNMVLVNKISRVPFLWKRIKYFISDYLKKNFGATGLFIWSDVKISPSEINKN